MNCAFCKAAINVKGKISREETCPFCGRDIKCCKQCNFFDTHAYNGCREVLAERVMDKERSNFCDYFVIRGSKKKSLNRSQDAKKALEDLFKKGN